MSRSIRTGSQASLATLAAVALAVVLILLLTVVPLANNDVWILMKVGELIVQTGKIPQTILFAFPTVTDNHFNAHEWLVSVIYHEFDEGFGLARLKWVVGIFALVQFFLSARLAWRRSRSLGIALLMALLAMICANDRYVLRPELFALLLLVCLLLALDRYRRERRWTTLLWTIPVAVVWANCHGSFLLAPVVTGLFALGEALTAATAATGTPDVRLRAGWRVGLPYAVAAVAMTAACAVNPAGWSLLAFPFQLQQSQAMRQLIKEWLPTFSPMFMETRAFWIFVAVGLVALATVVVRRRFLGFTDALLFLSFSALALERSRHIVWFGFIALYVCSGLVHGLASDRRRELQWRAACAGFALVALCACIRWGNVDYSYFYEAPSNNFSPALVAELADPGVRGNVFNSYELGGELIYREWPRLKPSIDSRVDSYGDDYLLFHLRLLKNEKLLDLFLDGNRVNYMLLLRRDLDAGVRNMPSIRANWRIRLTDGDIFLLERNAHVPLADAVAAPPPTSAPPSGWTTR